MSDDYPSDDLTLGDYNKTLEPQLLCLIETLDDNGTRIGFLLQETDGSHCLDIAHKALDVAVLQTEAFIQGGKIAATNCYAEIERLLASAKEADEKGFAPDDPARITACREWQRKRDNLSLSEAVSDLINTTLERFEIIEVVDPVTSLNSHHLIDETGKVWWKIASADKAVIGLVVTALVKGFTEGKKFTNEKIEILQAMEPPGGGGGKLN